MKTMIVEHRASLILFNVLSQLENKNKIFLLPANACPIVGLTYLKAGIGFELVDIDPTSLCIDEKIVLQRLTEYPSKYQGVHYIHTYGVSNNADPFFQQIKSIDSQIFVIDDKCLNIPYFRSDNIPDFVDLEFFSTGYSKYVDIGWGGFGYFHSNFNYKQKKIPYKSSDLNKITEDLKKCLENGTQLKNSDLDWLGDTSVIFSYDDYKNLVLGRLEEVHAHKHLLNSIYSEGLPDEIQLPMDYQNWRFNVSLEGRDRVLRRIFSEGFFASAHYASVTHIFGQTDAFWAEKKSANILNLFNDLRSDVDMAEKVLKIINKSL
jgi:hypothetical protein